MKNKLFLAAVFIFSFLSAYCFTADSLSGKYLYEYDHLKMNPGKKQKRAAVSGWDYTNKDTTKLLTLNPNGTFELELISPQGGFEVLPVKGNWKVTEEGTLILSGSQYYEGDLYFFQKTFSIFKGNLIERNLPKKKNKSTTTQTVPWIKQP